MSENEVAKNNAEVNETVNPKPAPKPAVRICEQIKDNGIRCGTPAIRGQHFCYFHIRAHRPHAPIGHPDYQAPVMESKHAAEIAVTHALQAITSGQLTPRQANSIFYGIHLATKILRMKEPPAETATPNAVTEISPVMRYTLAGREMPTADDYRPENVAKLASSLLHPGEITALYKTLQNGPSDHAFLISRYKIEGHYAAKRMLAEMGLLQQFTLERPDEPEPAPEQPPRKAPANATDSEVNSNAQEHCS